MRARAVLLALGLAAAAAAGCKPCQSRSDCDPGEYCDFDTSKCRQGCISDEDCGGISVCNTATGSCEVRTPPRPPPDAGLEDTGTSTVTDAGG